MNTVALLVVLVALAGAIGGIVNAIIYDGGFKLPRSVTLPDGGTILQPGSIGNAVVGIVAALVSWGLYGPAAAIPLLGTGLGTGTGRASHLTDAPFTLTTLMGAALVGIAGARWLTNEVDKKLLKATAAAAAAKEPNSRAARAIAAAPTAAAALDIVQQLPTPAHH